MKKRFWERGERPFFSEQAEAMPAAIITAIISSLLLLGIASIVSLVIQNKSDSESHVELTHVASNVDVSLRSDITQASYLTASVELKKPAEKFFTPTDVSVNGATMHIPQHNGECKVIRWEINETNISRNLVIFDNTLNTASEIKCDIDSSVIAERTKVFAQNAQVSAPFYFTNQAGRELAFTITDESLTKLNTQVTQNSLLNVLYRVSDGDLEALNDLLTSESYSTSFSDPEACVLNAEKVDGACPPAEADTVTAAWNSLKIAKISVKLQLQSDSGEIAEREITQNSSVPLYADSTEANAAVAGSSAENRPTKPVANLSTDKVLLGTNYTINWTSNAVCPAQTVRSFKLYENSALIKTQTTAGFTKNYTNAATEFLNYTVQVECIRGALVVNSDMSAPATAKVYPDVPTVSVTNEPSPANAPLNANLAAAAVCLYGTSPRYNLTQSLSSYGTPGTKLTNLNDVNRSINDGFTVVEGARYQYGIEAWCVTPYEQSAVMATNSGVFTTVINAPVDVKFIAPTPAANSMYQPTNATLSWSAANCAVGTTSKYYTTKDIDAGNPITPIVIDNWNGDLSYTTNAFQGHTVRYTVKARCEGSYLMSNETVTDYRQYTTLINAPGGFTATNDNYGTVTWGTPSVTCGPATSIQYRIHQTRADNNVVDVWGGWGTGNASDLPTYNTGGYPQWAEIQARCVGPNDTSAGTMSNTTKWVKRFDVSFTAWQAWRRINVSASCPFATSVGDFHLYVAADGWGGLRGVLGSIQTDEGATIADSQAGLGGNTGWLYMRQQQNTQWDDVVNNGTTHNWGYWGNAGWGSHYSGNTMSGTYWNAGGWGSWAYWYTGHCSSPYMNVYSKGGVWNGGPILNAGDPGTRYNSWPNGYVYTQAGIDATK